MYIKLCRWKPNAIESKFWMKFVRYQYIIIINVTQCCTDSKISLKKTHQVLIQCSKSKCSMLYMYRKENVTIPLLKINFVGTWYCNILAGWVNSTCSGVVKSRQPCIYDIPDCHSLSLSSCPHFRLDKISYKNLFNIQLMYI